MPMLPSGAICMAVYDPDPSLLAEQVDSIKRQTVKEWTCIIGIDGPDPSATAHLRKLTTNDSRFVIHEFSERVGFYRNFERILALVVDQEHQWVALSDQDDIWYHNKLEALLYHLDSTSMVVGQARLVRKSRYSSETHELGNTNRVFEVASELMLDNVVTGALSVFRADLLDYALPFPRKSDVSYHDHWLGLCATLHFGLITVQDVVQDYVQHDNNVIGEETRTNILDRLKKLARASGGGREVMRYFVNHRWRWRVTMARVALIRFPDASSRDVHILRAFAADRATLALTKIVVSALVDGRCSRVRVIGLWIASLCAPAVAEEELN